MAKTAAVKRSEGSWYQVRVNQRIFQEQLKTAFKVLGDLRIPFELIARDFYKSEKQIFQLKSAGGYEDLSPKYKALKESSPPAGVGFAYPILKRSGKLEASVTSRNSPGSLFFLNAKRLVIGTTVPYGIFHQSDAPRKKIPLRKFIFIDGGGFGFPKAKIFQGRSERWNNIVSDHLIQKLRLRNKKK